MKTAAFLAIATSCAFTLACAPEPEAEVVVVEGCITASEDEFILTDLTPAAPDPSLEHGVASDTAAEPTTEAYLLAGEDQDLRGAVGQHVRITGAADPAHVAEIRMINPMMRPANQRTASGNTAAPADAPSGTTGAPSGTTGGGSASAPDRLEPQIAVDEHLRFEVHRLQVRSISQTGEQCQL